MTCGWCTAGDGTSVDRWAVSLVDSCRREFDPSGRLAETAAYVINADDVQTQFCDCSMKLTLFPPLSSETPARPAQVFLRQEQFYPPRDTYE